MAMLNNQSVITPTIFDGCHARHISLVLAKARAMWAPLLIWMSLGASMQS